MIHFHKLLQRQLRNHTPGPGSIPENLYPFLKAVDAAYRQADEERALIQHSMEIVSTEHAERFCKLQTALEETARSSTENQQTLAMLQSILDSTSDGILVVDLEGRMVQSNRQFALLWGLPRRVVELADDDRAIAWVLSVVEDPAGFEARISELYDDPEASGFDVIRLKDGRVLERHSAPHWVDGVVAGRLWSFREVTERHELERQVQQAQKLDAIGKLAGGVAHDFNNLITVIDAHCEFLEVDLDGHAAEEVKEIRAAARRAASLTRQLLAFSRKQVLRPKGLDLCQVVEGVQRMIQRLIGEDIMVRTVLAVDSVRVAADLGQLEQVLVNLAVNARDAMPGGGTLTFRVDVATVEPDTMSLHGGTRPTGHYAVISIADNGSGMSRETVSQIFDPFFTTKEQGKGTGLGLSTVYGIVQQSNGHITVYSEEGIGTTFRVYLPVATDAVAALPLPLEETVARGSQTVLLVEDEEAVRRLTRRLLERHGYKVIEASNGDEALGLVTEGSAGFDMLLTDVVMPSLGGPGLASELLARRPELPVLFMSGYIENDMVRRGIVTGESRFLEKPFTAGALLAAVRQTLQAA